jgi:hypothetical protein
MKVLEIEALILDTISKNSIIKLNITESSIRKHFHKFAENNNLFHVSYCDKERKYETPLSYWCSLCKKYIKQNNYRIQSCCDNCGDFVVICRLCERDDDCTIIGDEDGAYDDVSVKETRRTNNIIAITNNIELIKDIFDKMKIKKPLEWMKKREAKF